MLLNLPVTCQSRGLLNKRPLQVRVHAAHAHHGLYVERVRHGRLARAAQLRHLQKKNRWGYKTMVQYTGNFIKIHLMGNVFLGITVHTLVINII